MPVPKTSNRFRISLALLATLVSFAAQAQMKVGLIASSTGPTAVVGIPQKNTAALLPKKIGDIDVEYIYYDDASDPTQSVALIKKLLTEDHVDAIVGPSGSPNAMGTIQFIAEAKTPMLAPVGTPAVVLPMDEQKKWVFKTTQNDDLISQALVSHMAKHGVKTVGFIGLNDAYGESWYRTFVPMAEKAGIKLVANERFARSDQSVLGQAAKIIAANPDAVLVGAAGGGDGAAAHDARRARLQGPDLPDARRGHARLHAPRRQERRGRGDGREPDARAARDARQQPLEEGRARLHRGLREDVRHASPRPSAPTSTTPACCCRRPCRSRPPKGKPGTPEFRAALRDALEQTKELVGTQGVYNMTAADHSGFDKRGRELMQLKDGVWHLIPE